MYRVGDARRPRARRPSTARTTSASQPSPALNVKYRSPARPSPIVRVVPAASRGADHFDGGDRIGRNAEVAREDVGVSARDRADGGPLPGGRPADDRPRMGTSCISPFTTSLIVPSPPSTSSASRPSAAAVAAMSRASPRYRVSTVSRSTSAASERTMKSRTAFGRGGRPGVHDQQRAHAHRLVPGRKVRHMPPRPPALLLAAAAQGAEAAVLLVAAVLTAVDTAAGPLVPAQQRDRAHHHRVRCRDRRRA